jgi:hypothetical protein
MMLYSGNWGVPENALVIGDWGQLPITNYQLPTYQASGQGIAE